MGLILTFWGEALEVFFRRIKRKRESASPDKGERLKEKGENLNEEK